MSYTTSEILNLIDKIAESYKPIYDLIIEGGSSYIAIRDAEAQVLGYDTYDKEYPLLYGIHQSVLKLGADQVPIIYRDSLTAISSAVSGLNSWLNTNDVRISLLENSMFKANSIIIDPTNVYPDGGQTMFTLEGNVLDPPSDVIASAGSSSGNFSDGTYYIVVTAINDCGETIGSTEVSVTLSGGTSTQSIDVTWDAVAGATGYKIYEGSTSGNEEYSGTSTTNSYTILDPATGSNPPTVNTAHNTTDGIEIDTTITGAAKAQYIVNSQGSSDLKLKIYEVLEDGTTTTEDITITANSASGSTFDLVNEVADITKIEIYPDTPGTATDSGIINTVADR